MEFAFHLFPIEKCDKKRNCCLNQTNQQNF